MDQGFPSISKHLLILGCVVENNIMDKCFVSKNRDKKLNVCRSLCHETLCCCFSHYGTLKTECIKRLAKSEALLSNLGCKM